jgi:hypothetical protein
MTGDREHRPGPGAERPGHPTKQAIWLLVGVTVLLVALAFMSAR